MEVTCWNVSFMPEPPLPRMPHSGCVAAPRAWHGAGAPDGKATLEVWALVFEAFLCILGIVPLFKGVTWSQLCHQDRSPGPDLLEPGYWPCSAVPLYPNDYLRSSFESLKGISHLAYPNFSAWSFSPNLFFSPSLLSHLSK